GRPTAADDELSTNVSNAKRWGAHGGTPLQNSFERSKIGQAAQEWERRHSPLASKLISVGSNTGRTPKGEQL
ncbi:MAG: hypothetical protein ND866_08730, partial [Pyrinomonadaceae bacterium]|nr:hypothetical protein [Pyrinomonadaceae bacterium]